MDDTAGMTHSDPTVSAPCPACAEGRLAPCDQIVDLGEVVRRWGEVVGTMPPEELVTRYRSQGPCKLHECECCGLGMFLPVVPGDEDFYRFVSAVDYYLDDRWDFQESLRVVGRRRPRSVLDIGCGTGGFLGHIKARFPDIDTFGQDLNKNISTALEADGHRFVGRDLSTLADSSVDFVSALQVLEHAIDPEACLLQLARVGKPLSAVVVSVPDSDSLVGNFPDALTELPPHHVTRWNEGALRALMERCGLEVISVTRQPLEKYLWDSYIDAALAARPWFMGFLAPFVEAAGDPAEMAKLIRKQWQARGIDCLWGVDSHTVLVEARVAPGDQGANTAGQEKWRKE